jgi:dCTP deaminase
MKPFGHRNGQMILSDVAIIRALDSGEIVVQPPIGPEHVRPVGIRLHLGPDLLIPEDGPDVDIMAGETPRFGRATLDGDGYVLGPKAFVLGSSQEMVQVSPALICHLDGRSTLARLGLMIHCTAGVIDNNNDEARSIVLEMYNFSRVGLRLRKGMPIGMLTFEKLTDPIIQQNGTPYSGQSGVWAPDLNFHASGRHLAEGFRLTPPEPG